MVRAPDGRLFYCTADRPIVEFNMCTASRLTHLVALLLSTQVVGEIAWAAKPGGTVNNVIVDYDPQSNTVLIRGNESNNYIYVSVDDGLVNISGDPWDRTTVNGQNQVAIDVDLMGVTVLIDTASGQDTVWVGIGTAEMPIVMSVSGGDDADNLAFFHLTRPLTNFFGRLDIDGGRGDDLIELIEFKASGFLFLNAGENNDEVSITAGTGLSGDTAIYGGKGRDRLTIPAGLLGVVDYLAGFETITSP